ncbi:hypothetical protein Bca101_037508 [Brassica carinata]
MPKIPLVDPLPCCALSNKRKKGHHASGESSKLPGAICLIIKQVKKNAVKLLTLT